MFNLSSNITNLLSELNIIALPKKLNEQDIIIDPLILYLYKHFILDEVICNIIIFL